LSDAVAAQTRALRMSQDWSQTILTTLKEQAESYQAMLASVDASMRAMERAIQSQAESTQALAESLESSRRVVTGAMDAQEHSIERVERFVGGLLDVLTGQSQAISQQMEIGQAMLTDPLSAQSAAFTELTQQWLSAYGRLLGTGPAQE